MRSEHAGLLFSFLQFFMISIAGVPRMCQQRWGAELIGEPHLCSTFLPVCDRVLGKQYVFQIFSSSGLLRTLRYLHTNLLCFSLPRPSSQLLPMVVPHLFALLVCYIEHLSSKYYQLGRSLWASC